MNYYIYQICTVATQETGGAAQQLLGPGFTAQYGAGTRLGAAVDTAQTSLACCGTTSHEDWAGVQLPGGSKVGTRR